MAKPMDNRSARDGTDRVTLTALVSREVTQAKLDPRSVAASRYRASHPDCITERLEATVREHGARDALIYGDKHDSYAELNRQVNRAAHALHAQGVRCGDVVAICLENRPGFFHVWLGLAKLGAIAAFLNTNVRGRPLEHALVATGAQWVVVGEECLGLFDGLETPLPLWLWPDVEQPATPVQRALCELDLGQEASNALDTNPPAVWRDGLVAGDPAIYIFTSGTTGLPKAAVISHARWLIAGDVMQISTGLKPSDCFYVFLPLYHGAASLSAAATAITAGASLLVRRKFSRREFWLDVRRCRVTACQYVGEICRFLLSTPEHPDDREHTLRIMVGAGLATETWEQWVHRFGPMDIFEGWGSTESNTNLVNVDNRVGSCGRVPFWEKTNLRLVRYDIDSGTHPRGPDGFLQLVDVDEPGEAIGRIVDLPDVVAGRFEGYTSASATERKILRNVFREGDAWWSSGDLLRCDADGYCWFVDRVGDTFRWNSENVSTAEVADQLADFPGMEALTVYGVQVPGHEGRAGMAAVVMQPDVGFDPVAFWVLATQRLPRYARPLFVRVAPAVDMTGNYKLRKVDLQREGFDASQVSDPLYLRDDAAETYVELTVEALKRVLRG